jgi:hypothetical protein
MGKVRWQAVQVNNSCAELEGSSRPPQSGHCIHSQSLIHVEDAIWVAVMEVSRVYSVDLVVRRLADDAVAEPSPDGMNLGTTQSGVRKVALPDDRSRPQ